MSRVIHGSIFAILCCYIALFLATVFECTPIRKSWIARTPGHCFPQKVLPYTSGTLNVASDILVLVLPIPCIWGLNMKIGRKLRVLSVFGLGILYEHSIQC